MKKIIILIFTLVVLEGSFLSSVLAQTMDKNILVVGTTMLNKLLSTAKHSAPANIISLNHTTISSEITGRALKIYVESGDYVKKGKKLVELDCKSYLLAQKQAKAVLKLAITQLNHAKKQFARNQRLLKQGTIPRELYDKAEAGQLTALADIELKKISIESTNLTIHRCVIKSPFSGQITKRMVQKGQLVTAGTPLLKLMQSNKKEVKTQLSLTDVEKLKASSIIKFVTSNTEFKVAIRSIIQNIDELTRTQEVRLALPNNTRVAAGRSGRIEWADINKQLPAEYILRRDNKLGVMTVVNIVDGVGKVRFIMLDNAKEGQASFISLPDYTAIITNNRYRVQDGDTVRVEK